MQYPLSREEQTAMVRCISGIRKQLQDVSELFTTRYGKDSSIAGSAVKTLVSSTLLEQELALFLAREGAEAKAVGQEVAHTAY